jgi:hypothetical protein
VLTRQGGKRAPQFPQLAGIDHAIAGLVLVREADDASSLFAISFFSFAGIVSPPRAPLVDRGAGDRAADAVAAGESKK